MEYFLDKGGQKGISLPGTLLNNYKGKKVAFTLSAGTFLDSSLLLTEPSLLTFTE